MFEVDIPGRRHYKLKNLVLDINGTLALDGNLDEATTSKIRDLKNLFDIYIVTAGTHGKLDQISESLGIDIHEIEASGEAEQKQEFVENLSSEKTISIGNGSNDALMLKKSAIGIAVIGGEGASTEAVFSSDVVVNNIADAFDLLLKPKRLIATLRK